MITELKSVLLDDFWIMPQTPKYTESGIPYVTSKNIKNEKINFENVNYISIEDYKKISKNRPILKNDILISMIGTLGETAIVDDSYGEFYGQNMFLVRLDNSKIDYRYFINFFKSTYVKNHLARKQNKSTQSYLKANHIESLMIPVITIKEQKEIANQLDKVQDLIKLKTQQIEKLDDLIKSQFVEMFGNPFLNDKKWKIKKLKEISISIADGSNVDKKYYKTKGDVLFLRIQNVWRNEFRLEDSVFISKEENKEYIDTSLKYGDILICKIGRNYTKDTSLGRVAIYLGEDDKANYSNNIMKIRLADEVNSKFVNMLLNLEDYQDHIKRVSKGGTDKRALNKSIIGDLPIILPPKAMQDEYINKIERIDKQKSEIEKSLKEMQELYESLMDKYFG